jgi:hypothetical protein
MQIVLWTWLVSAALTLGMFVAVSWIFDRRVVFSTWVKLALAVLMPAGPIGTVLMATLLLKTSLHTLREIRRQEQPLVGLEQAEA